MYTSIRTALKLPKLLNKWSIKTNWDWPYNSPQSSLYQTDHDKQNFQNQQLQHWTVLTKDDNYKFNNIVPKIVLSITE